MSKVSSEMAPILDRGVETTAAQLEKLSREPWKMSPVSESIEELRELHDAQRELYGISFAFGGGRCIVLFSPESSRALSTALIEQPSDWLDDQSELMESFGLASLEEVANILVHGIVNTIADARGVALLVSAPKTDYGPLEKLLPSRKGRRPPQSVSWFSLSSAEASCAVAVFMDPAVRKRPARPSKRSRR